MKLSLPLHINSYDIHNEDDTFRHVAHMVIENSGDIICECRSIEMAEMILESLEEKYHVYGE